MFGQINSTYRKTNTWHESNTYDIYRVQVELQDVWGTVQVLPADTSVWSTCSWSFSAGILSYNTTTHKRERSSGSSSVRTTSSATPFTRSGFSISPGCAITGSSFLPSVTLARRELWVDGLPRYLGNVDRSSWRRDLRRDSDGTGQRDRTTVYTSSWAVDTLDEGGTWTHTAP